MISIITPSFNQGKYIERTILSVLSQSVSDLEYVVVDGASHDNTLDILAHYASQLRYISEKDHGQTHAINKGLKMTSGNIIGWLNSDDVYYPHALKAVEEFFTAHPDIDVVYGKADYIDEYDQFIESYPTENWDVERLKQICFLAQPAVFFRRRVLDRCGMLDENLKYCMDYEFWLRLALHKQKFSYLPSLLATYRLYPETKTVSKAAEAQLEAIMMLHQKLGYVPVNWLIYQAVVTVRKKTNLSMPQKRYIFSLFIVAVFLGFRWNGFFNGIKSFFSLPKAMLALRRLRQSQK